MSIRKIMKAFIVAALCFAQIVPAVAGTTALKPLTNSAFVDLGTGNLLIEGNDTQKAIVCEADTQPIVSTTGCHIVGSRPLPFSTDSHLWGRAFGSSAMVIVSPLTASISGGATDANLNTQIAALIQAIQNGTAATQAAALTPPVQIKSQSLAVIDHASSAITITGNDTAIVLDSGSTYAARITISAVTGTNPTADFILQESFDNGANFRDIFWCNRLKTASDYCDVPEMQMTGQRRWRWNIGGTASPSFTAAINGTRGTGVAPLIRRFYDYTTINPNTQNSFTPTWNVDGCKTTEIFAFVNTTSSAAVFQIAQSPDGTNFGTIGSTINPGNNTLSMQNVQHPMPYARIVVTTAGTSQTNNYVGLHCTN